MNNDIPATERTWHVETLEKVCLEGVLRVSSTWLGNPEAREHGRAWEWRVYKDWIMKTPTGHRKESVFLSQER